MRYPRNCALAGSSALHVGGSIGAQRPHPQMKLQLQCSASAATKSNSLCDLSVTFGHQDGAREPPQRAVGAAVRARPKCHNGDCYQRGHSAGCQLEGSSWAPVPRCGSSILELVLGGGGGALASVLLLGRSKLHLLPLPARCKLCCQAQALQREHKKHKLIIVLAAARSQHSSQLNE